MALIVLVVLLLHQTCSAKDTNRDCVPSSCGNIPNISSPFRLEHDPLNCGNPRYALSCQDNQTVLYILSVEHYVQEINYTSQTIRVVDSGIQKNNYSSIPPYSDFGPYYRQDGITETMVMLNCEKRVNSPWYLNKSTCFGNRAYASNSSSSQPEAGFRYVIYNQTIKAGDVEDLCQVEHRFQTSWPSVRNLPPEDQSSISCTDLHNLLLYGFELSWFTDCGTCGIFEFAEERYCCKRHTGKGTLRSGQLGVIKMLGKFKANGQEFISEVATIGRIHHINVVQLIGFCVEGSKRALIYDILLSYKNMHDIALGVARGIEYLHRGCQMQILHFDIKPHNVLLDEDFTPKVSDFGLAKLGTLGYMAPELCYKNIGSISYKANVYSFGMLLMDMMGKRKNLNAIVDQSSQYFPTCVYEEMKPNDRPSMIKVVEMLKGGIESLQIPPKPFLSSPERQPEDIEDNSTQTFLSIQSSQYTQSSIQSN
ncbi:hypothetical protein I3843_05G175700 [Carya illinoinensis]|nr:hypothetical protein I3843_05G175700 [Carya illinoinensis]